jgi:hypothetical protein
MIEVIQGLAAHVTAFRATGIVTRDYYYKVINPLEQNVATAFGKINYMPVLNTKLKNYTFGASIEDGLLGFRYFSKWKKLTIVTEREGIKKFTNTFGIFIRCPTKGFTMDEIIKAKEWISDL